MADGQDLYLPLALNVDAVGDGQPLPAARLASAATLAAALLSLGAGLARHSLGYGATGDGVTDDTVGLQAAMDATPAFGTLVLVPPPGGAYLISADLVRTDAQGPINIVGQGGQYGGVRIVRSGTTGYGFDFRVLESAVIYAQDRACRVHGVRLEGSLSATAGAGIRCLGAIHLDQVTTDGFYDGLYLRAQASPTSGPYYSHATRSMFGRAVRCGVRSAESPNHNLNFAVCRFESNPYGLYVAGNSAQTERLMVRDCCFERHTVCGLYLDWVRAATVEGNYFETPTSNAKDLVIGPSNLCQQITLQGNWHTNHPDAANVWHVDADKVDGLTLVGCDLPGASGTGGDVRLTANSKRVALLNTRYVTAVGLPAMGGQSLVVGGSGDVNGNAVGVSLSNFAGGTVKAWAITIDSAFGKGVNFSETGVADGRLFVAAGGNVGFGTTSPAYTAHFQAAGNATLGIEAGTGLADLVLKQGGAERWQVYTGGGDANLKFYDGSNRATLIANGSVVTLNP